MSIETGGGGITNEGLDKEEFSEQIERSLEGIEGEKRLSILRAFGQAITEANQFFWKGARDMVTGGAREEKRHQLTQEILRKMTSELQPEDAQVVLQAGEQAMEDENPKE